MSDQARLFEPKELPERESAADEQLALFENPPAWTEHWEGMPKYNQRDLMPWQTVMVHFRNATDRAEFSKIVESPITDDTKSLWYPRAQIEEIKHSTVRQRRHPKYPVYVISKGRWATRLTVKELERLGVSYRVVVEPQEFSSYSAVIDSGNILQLPFSNLGQGSIPARNWVWDHSISEGAERHWILDDNIRSFTYLSENKYTRASSGDVFCNIEEFADRYENCSLAAMNYFMFAKRKQLIPPFVLNTRCYSCILIQNDLAFRWRGRYNEDTDLSLRVLKAGLCTVQFNAFLADKQTSMVMKGGNTDQLYQEDGRRKMAESLKDQHPDVTTITSKFGHWQHQVDYSGFKKNRLILKPGVVIPEEPEQSQKWVVIE